VRFSLTAARTVRIANHSLDPLMARGAKELAAFLLGIARTLEAIDPVERAAWQHALDKTLGTSVVDLQRATGDPTFMDRTFLTAIERYSDEFPDESPGKDGNDGRDG
jgi:hypothetical protein